MGQDFKRRATETEIDAMRDLVDEAMRNGSFGLSSDLDPDPGEYAHADELVALARVAHKYRGLYTAHTRHHENSWWADTLEQYSYGLTHSPRGEVITGRYHGLLEAVEIARLAGPVPLLIGHMTPAYIIPQPQPRGLEEAAARATLDEIIDAPRAEGMTVHYNVIAHSGSVGSRQRIASAFVNPALLLPDWLKGMKPDEVAARLHDASFRGRLLDVILSGKFKFFIIHPITDPYWFDSFRVLQHRNPAYVGKTIGEIARQRERDHVIDLVYRESFATLFDVVEQDPDAAWALILDKRENPGALPVFLRHPAGMPATDCQALDAVPPPNPPDVYFRMAYGLFPHYLRTFVREEGALTLEEAIHKATYLPAQEVLGLADRGVVRPGAFADLLLLDAERVRDRGTFAEPALPPDGIEYVIVNGQVVYKGMKHTGARPGKVLRKAQERRKRR